MNHGKRQPQVSKALHILGKFFSVDPETFNRLSNKTIADWASQVTKPGYTLTNQQHKFLVGELSFFRT